MKKSMKSYGCYRFLVPCLCLAALLSSSPAAAQRFGMWPTDSRGSLALVRHDVRVTVTHPVAETVVTQEFENRSSFDREATFYYPVPEGAVVHGMALWVNGVRREARMLERHKAREIYQGIVNEKRDPALLERMDGNIFRMRIFPVLAKSRQRVELRFVQPVTAEAAGRYRLTLRKPPGTLVDVLRLSVTVRAPFALSSLGFEGHRGRFARRGDAFVMAMPAARRSFANDIRLRYSTRAAATGPRVVTTDAGDRTLFVAELPAAKPRQPARNVAVLVDCSLSMADKLRQARMVTRSVLGKLEASARAAVVPFSLVPLSAVKLLPPSEALDRAETLLDAVEPKLGTSFVPAVRRALSAGATHLVLVTDGATEFHQGELEHLLRLLVDRPGVTLSVVSLPGAQNGEILSDLARASGGDHVQLAKGDDLDGAAVRATRRVSRSGVALSAAAAASAPNARAEVDLVSRGPASLVVTGSVPRDQRSTPLSLTDLSTGKTLTISLSVDHLEAAGVSGLYASAAITRLTRRIKVLDAEQELRPAVVALSKTHNVVSEYTALLATDTDADYNRPTSGRTWQRKVRRVDDNLPSTEFHSTPEPHEWALILLALAALVVANRRGWLSFSPSTPQRPA